jgi:hypothetical protein
LRISRDPGGRLAAEEWETGHAGAGETATGTARAGDGAIEEVGVALVTEMGRIHPRIAKNREFLSVGFHSTVFRLTPSAADLGFVAASEPGGARSGG